MPPPRGSRRLIVLFALTALAAAAWTAGAASRVPEATTPAPAAAVTLRVVGFNAWLLPIGAKDLERRRAALPAALAALAPDVVCLQEVWGRREQETLAAALADRLPHVAHANGGLVILSRHPITDTGFVPFPESDALSLVERIARKGLQTAIVATPAGAVRVVNTHLALDRSAGQAGRRAQLRFLVDWLQEHRDLPIVLAGDLNMAAVGRDGRLTADYRWLVQDAGFADAGPPVARGPDVFERRPYTRIGWPRPRETPSRGWAPDFLFSRSGATRRLELVSYRMALDTPDTALSDHNLLVGEWRVLPQDEAPR